MRSSSARRSRKSGSVMILFTLMLPTLLLPLAGLAIDATVARLIQIRLQAAVDGAVLGAGRLLGTPAVPATLAAEFLTANFRTDNIAGTWNAYNLQSNVVYTPGITKRIDVNASAQVPLLFLRILGFNSATVGAAGSATRSDSRVVWVIDRSGSMTQDDGSGTMVVTDAINYTTSLVERFIEGTDELGLVVFDGSAVVGFPTAAAGGWTPSISLASTGGPSKTFWDGTANDMPHQLAAITANSGTGMAEALSIAYIEIQKAHMRDLNADGVDTRLNSIVLLTDGVPSGITLYANDPSNSNANNIVTGSTSGGNCLYKTITAPGTSANMMKNWFAIPGPPYSTSSGNPYGMYLLASTDPAAAHTSNWWMQNGGADAAIPNPTTPYNNAPSKTCGMMNNSGNTTYSYFSKIPAQDAYGNLTNTGKYSNSHITGGGSLTTIYNGTALDPTKPNLDYHWGLAMWDAVDSAAKNIRTDANLANRTGDTTGNMFIQIYVIGYTGNGGCDDGLLKRVANDAGAAGYDATQPQGQYYSASNGAELADAYQKLASDLLRLAR
ncbi:MAG: pilus assembly protein TadG-related protein [Candidatus Solibacter sp.]